MLLRHGILVSKRLLRKQYSTIKPHGDLERHFRRKQTMDRQDISAFRGFGRQRATAL